MNTVSDKENLMSVLDFILNRCTVREIDAVEAAVIRRKKDLGALGGLSSVNPSNIAKEMSGAVQKSIDASMDSIRNTVRGFASDMIAKEAPELNAEQQETLLQAWIPSKKKVSGIPADALYSMILQFIQYSTGNMSIFEQESLREVLGDWSTVYWKKFPQPIKVLIKSYLQGDISNKEFQNNLEEILGS